MFFNRLWLTIFLSVFFVLNTVSFLAPQNTLGQNKRALEVVPDKEMRSSIHAVDGYAYFSENMTLADIRAAAFANAKRLALEMAQTYIKSKTKVEDFVATYDIIWSEAEGAISIIEQKDYGIEENTRYHVWIKAEVQYKLQPKKETIKGLEMNEDAPLTVKVWTSKKKYKGGENIEIFIHGNRDFYAKVVDISSDGNIIQLLPNDYHKINFFEAGKAYKIPDKNDRFKLIVRPPYGEDQIVVYASEAPLGNVEMEKVGQGLSSYMGTREAFAAKTRGISVIASKLEAGSGVEFYEALWKFKTEK